MLEVNYKSKDFIRAYNNFSDVGNEFHLTYEEFYLYCTLFTKRMMDESIITNIDMINQYLKIPLGSSHQRNIKKIKVVLKSLINKRVFISRGNIDMNELKNNTIIVVTINDEELCGKSVGAKGFKNFAQIPFLKFAEFENARDAYIYYVVARWGTGAKYPISRWAEILNISEKQASTIIKQTIERGIIFKNIGNYIENENGGQKQQEPNTYYINAIPQAQKTAQTKKIEAENNKVEEGLFADALGEGKKITKTREYSFDIGNWKDIKVFLDDNDFDIYHHAKEKAEINDNYREFIMLCEKRIKVIGIKNIKDKMKQAEDRFESRKRDQEVMHARAITHMNSMEDDSFQSSYKRKENKKDITAFMDD